MTDKALEQKMLEKNVVTKQQIREAINRQRTHGGSLSQNLVALGYIKEDEVEQIARRRPTEPENIPETGLDLEFLSDLALRHIMTMGTFRLSDLSKKMGLSTAIMDEIVNYLRQRKLVEVRSATEFVKSSFNFVITELGKKQAGELMEICRYVGPAPVTLSHYREIVDSQSISNIRIDYSGVRKAFSHLVINDSLVGRLGPAISSGAAMFIYGPPGNGKTTIAEAIGRVLPETVYVPHALYVGGQIIRIFDPVNHHPAEEENSQSKESLDSTDQRWVLIRRPVVITGGELSLRMLDLEFNTIAKFYEAPLQMKANNGLFIVDDFGRQQMDPQSLLNRWIINLDRQIDFMSLHTGMKFEIPFDQLVIFSTNLEPRTLVDEAFLRRMRYKIKIDHPTEGDFREIFKRVCQTNDIAYREDILDYLLEHWYRRHNIAFNACHPRDLIGQIMDDARYHDRTPELTRVVIDQACENYFVQ